MLSHNQIKMASLYECGVCVDGFLQTQPSGTVHAEDCARRGERLLDSLGSTD